MQPASGAGGGDGADYGFGGSGGGGGSGGDSGSVSGDNHASEMPESLCGTNGLDVATASVSPGESLGPYETAAEATNVMSTAKFAPSAEVEAKLGKGSDALETYRGMFGFEVVPTSDGKWAVAAFLKPQDWTNVVESAQTATRQIPVADIAALELGVPTDVTVTNCVPGFYYTIYGGSTVTNLKAFVSEKSRNVLCEPGKPVKFSEVVKPSDAADFISETMKSSWIRGSL